MPVGEVVGWGGVSGARYGSLVGSLLRPTARLLRSPWLLHRRGINVPSQGQQANACDQILCSPLFQMNKLPPAVSTAPLNLGLL